MEGMEPKALPLTEAPFNVPLRVVEILGGHGARRRLLSMGFHRGDVIELDSQAILNGPLVVRNVETDTKIALGRGIAQRILVEVADERR